MIYTIRGLVSGEIVPGTLMVGTTLHVGVLTGVKLGRRDVGACGLTAMARGGRAGSSELCTVGAAGWCYDGVAWVGGDCSLWMALRVAAIGSCCDRDARGGHNDGALG